MNGKRRKERTFCGLSGAVPLRRCLEKIKWQPLNGIFWAEEETHKENKNAYYKFLEDEAVADRILQEFHVTGECTYIVNGHVPVHHRAGRKPH